MKRIAGRYDVVRVIGRGGMGAVYEALHTWTGRRVALKTLLPHLASDPKAVERFRREARAGVQGAHPNIPDVLDMGVDPEDGTLYLAQELLVGEDLAARLAREQTLPVQAAYEALIPAMAALDAAHRAGVVHRDVKPANLFLVRAPDGSVSPRVIDFGIANLADAAPVTHTGAPLGTPQYMAPEQARGARDVDARADVWSIGAVWFEALSGRRLVEGDAYHDVLARVLTATPTPLRAVAAALPVGLCAAVDGALRTDRAARHPSMAAFAQALFEVPELSEAPWLLALRQRHPFPLTAPPDDVAPRTLDAADNVTPPETPRLDDTPALPVAPPPPSSADTIDPALRPAPRPEPRVGLVAVALLVTLVAAGAWWLGRPVSPTAPVRAALHAEAAPPPQPTPSTTPTVPSPSMPVAPAPPPTPQTLAVTTPPAAREPPRRVVRNRAPALQRRPEDTGARGPVINGAPVLEP